MRFHVSSVPTLALYTSCVTLEVVDPCGEAVVQIAGKQTLRDEADNAKNRMVPVHRRARVDRLTGSMLALPVGDPVLKANDGDNRAVIDSQLHLREVSVADAGKNRDRMNQGHVDEQIDIRRRMPVHITDKRAEDDKELDGDGEVARGGKLVDDGGRDNPS